MDPIKVLIRRFDGWLSRVERVEPFADGPRIILRLQHSSAAWDIPLGDRTISAGSPVAVLHFWNERIPVLTSQGADLQWALNFQRRLLYSFKVAARHLQDAAVMQDIEAVGGVIAQIHLQPTDGGRNLVEHLGFTVFPYHRPAGAFGEFWENFYTWLLMWTYNPGSLRSHALFGLERNEFWTTKERFLGRFGIATEVPDRAIEPIRS
jgi:hypothetical protein